MEEDIIIHTVWEIQKIQFTLVSMFEMVVSTSAQGFHGNLKFCDTFWVIFL